jgi:hypothetical protein
LEGPWFHAVKLQESRSRGIHRWDALQSSASARYGGTIGETKVALINWRVRLWFRAFLFIACAKNWFHEINTIRDFELSSQVSPTLASGTTFVLILSLARMEVSNTLAIDCASRKSQAAICYLLPFNKGRVSIFTWEQFGFWERSSENSKQWRMLLQSCRHGTALHFRKLRAIWLFQTACRS